MERGKNRAARGGATSKSALPKTFAKPPKMGGEIRKVRGEKKKYMFGKNRLWGRFSKSRS